MNLPWSRSVISRQHSPMAMGRADSAPFAATRVITGSEVDYGALTHLLVKYLSDQPGFHVHYNRKVVGLDREDDGALARLGQGHP
jgi:malate dehydrogenase (quinone)